MPTLACYGQPGSSWAAQAVAALKQIGVAPLGVPCYVDEGTHVGLNQKPFWYSGALNVYHMGANYTRMELHDPAALEPAKKKVSAIAERLASPPDTWAGRAGVDWLRRLNGGGRFDASTPGLFQTAEALDALYASARQHTIKQCAERAARPRDPLIEPQGGACPDKVQSGSIQPACQPEHVTTPASD